MPLVRIADAVEWLEYGQEQGWASRVFCAAHDVAPYSEEEVATAKGAGQDPLDRCAWAVRVW